MKKTNLEGQTFGKLFVLKKVQSVKQKSKYLCQCSCNGNQKTYYGYKIKSGNTISCGCAKSEATIKRNKIGRIYEVGTEVSHSAHKNRYADCPYNDFMILSQQGCFYCNLYFSNLQVNFKYNGLDSINCKNAHTTNNVVTCCFQCNRSKSHRSFKDHIIYIKNIININNRLSFNDYRQLSNNIEIPSLLKNNTENACILYCYKGYNDGNLTLEQFYKLSQLNCYYCGQDKDHSNKYYRQYSKKYNIKTHTFYSNGLDQIIPSQGHNYDNVIPCCRYCNFAKSNQSIEQFYSWIDRLKENQFWNKIIDNKINNGICEISL